MSESLGTITYDVEIETAALLKPAKDVNAALDDLESKMSDVDKQGKKATVTLGETGKKLDDMADAGKGAADGLDKVDTGLKEVTDSAGKGAKAIDKVNTTQKEGGSAAGAFLNKLNPLAVAVAGVVTIDSLKRMGELAEQFTLLQSRIARLTPDIATATTTYDSLMAIASQTGQTLPATVKLWETLTSSLKALGATQGQVTSLTSELQKIGKIGGSSADETANALRQLGQSLASGKLQAEEYNSIIDQTPELIRTLAKGAGMSMGDFRAAMLAGKISSQDLFDYLQKASSDVDTEFKKLPRSASDAGNAVSVAFGAALSVIDKATGSSQLLAKALDAVARGIQITFNPTGQEQFNKLLQEREDILALISKKKGSLFDTDTNVEEARLAAVNKQLKEMADARVAAQKKESADADAPKVKADTSPQGQKELQSLKDQAAALSVQGVERAQLLAVQKLGSSATDKEIAQAKELAAQIYNQQEAEKAGKKDAAKDSAEAAAGYKANAEEVKKLSGELTKVGLTGKQAAQEAAVLSLKTEYATPDQIAKVKELAGAIYDLNEKNKGVQSDMEVFKNLGLQLGTVNMEGKELAQLQAERSLSKFATPDEVKTVRDMAGALYDLNEVQANKKTLAAVDPKANTQQSYDLELKQLQALNAAKLLSDQDYLSLKQAAETKYNADMTAIEEARFRAQSAGNEAIMASFDALASSGTQAISGLLSGTSSLKDALGGVANTVLNAVIGSFVQAGVEWVKQEAFKQTAVAATTAAQTTGIATVAGVQAGATAAIAATTTTTAATTGAAVSGSMAPAAGLSSIASFGGAAVIGGSALLATMLLAKSFGGRQYGGDVAAGGMYRVNETGAPEIFNASNGRQYMMPNQRGEVVSNKDATAGSGGGTGAAPIVNVHNYTGQTGSSAARFSEADKRWIIDTVVGDAAAGGKIGRTVNQITGTKRAGS